MYQMYLYSNKQESSMQLALPPLFIYSRLYVGIIYESKKARCFYQPATNIIALNSCNFQEESVHLFLLPGLHRSCTVFPPDHNHPSSELRVMARAKQGEIGPVFSPHRRLLYLTHIPRCKPPSVFRGRCLGPQLLS